MQRISLLNRNRIVLRQQGSSQVKIAINVKCSQKAAQIVH